MKDFSISLSFICASLLALLLSACGGAPLDNPNYLRENGLGRDITVNLSGASGPMTISLDGQTVSFTEDGSQTIEGLNPIEEITASIATTPDDQQCFFSPSNLTEITASDTVNVVCGSPSISGSVKNFFTGAAITGATISVSEYTGGAGSAFTTTTSDADGNYVVEDTVADNRYVVTVSAAGFATQSVIGLPTSARPFVIENISMVPQNGTDTATPTGAMSFVVEGVTVLEIPANGLVRADASAPVGDVTARLTLIEPSGGANALPGRYEYNSGSSVSFMETFGALGVTLTDSEGSPVFLADGTSATVRVPIATRASASAPASASVYLYDEDSGYWITQTAATETTNGGADVYESTVTDLPEVIASGQTYTTVQIEGCIEDSSGNGVVDATIYVQGSSYIGTSYSVSDASGDFSVVAKADSEVFVYGLVGARSRTQSVTTTTSNATLSECLLFDLDSTVVELTWGQTPSDLDSHLYGPDGSGSRFHIDWTNRSQTVNDVDIFLDVDDVTSFGPEVTTIPSFPAAGTYEFYVDNFSGTADIAISPARVSLNQQGESFLFSPPSAGATRCWHVFNLEVDSALDAEVVIVNEFIADRSVCIDSGQVTTNGPAPTLQKPSPGTQAILRKYYAE